MAEGGGLLNRYTVKSCIGGSNPPLSARLFKGLQPAETKQIPLASHAGCRQRRFTAHH